jgi:putative hemolysin
MSSTAVQLGLVALLVLLNAAFAASEMALLSMGEARVARLAEKGRSGRALAQLTADPNRFLATIQVGITLAGFLASATAAVSLAEPLTGPLGFLGGAARPAAIVIVTLLLTYFTLVVGELAPKRVALQRGDRLALITARPLRAMFSLFRPVVWLLGRSTDLVVRLCGVDPSVARQEVTEEDLRDLVSSAQTLTDDQRELLEGALEVAERSLRQVVRPRREVLTVPGGTEAADALTLMAEEGRSRVPVVAHDLDNTIGIVHLRDLVGRSGPVAALSRPALALPETLDVLASLRQMRLRREQMALVIDEHGGVEGIVTLEDLLEEIVGEIYDETDRDLAEAIHLDGGGFEVVGGFPVHDLDELGVSLPAGDYATLAGLVMDRLGRVPAAGDSVSVDGWVLDVLAVDGHAVRRIRLRPEGGRSARPTGAVPTPGADQPSAPGGPPEPPPGGNGAADAPGGGPAAAGEAGQRGDAAKPDEREDPGDAAGAGVDGARNERRPHGDRPAPRTSRS